MKVEDGVPIPLPPLVWIIFPIVFLQLQKWYRWASLANESSKIYAPEIFSKNIIKIAAKSYELAGKIQNTECR